METEERPAKNKDNDPVVSSEEGTAQPAQEVRCSVLFVTLNSWFSVDHLKIYKPK